MSDHATSLKRMKVSILGAVQGIGFRPFIYRLANELGIRGFVLNTGSGVVIEAEGLNHTLEQFLSRIRIEKPGKSFIQSLESVFLDPQGYDTFEIRESSASEKSALIMPDIATCSECLEEIFNPANIRYLYPFTNCTNCGPRYSIIESLPYDRQNTTMREFTMCESCRKEYSDPENRRFHAQPNACPECGPRLSLLDGNGKIICGGNAAMDEAVKLVKKGFILALKGLGGFQLIIDASDINALKTLRERKHRSEKPFALMYPSLELIEEDCHVFQAEKRLVSSSESPIVLLHKKKNCRLPDQIAPGNPCLGVMLPYTPLHHILMRGLKFPVVATSGNISEEPIITDETEALTGLKEIADYFLVHDRKIARQVDDSIARIIMDREMILRRSRGYAPLPVYSDNISRRILAAGAHLKNTFAFSADGKVFISQHIGDLETEKAFNAFKKNIADLQAMYDFKPEIIACDLHPGYMSSNFAASKGIEIVRVQHHYAHVLSCAEENEVKRPFLGVSWDGTGYGPDNTVWGGEFLKVDDKSFTRAGHLLPFPLPGGEAAVREPRRSAIGLLYAVFGKDVFSMNDIPCMSAFSSMEKENIRVMLEKKINSPLTTSAGRMFDAVASILGLNQTMQFEGQAAMALEFLTDGITGDDLYPFNIEKCGCSCNPHYLIDLAFIKEILNDLKKGIARDKISLKFHNTLSEIIVTFSQKSGQERVVLSGGCFQNRYLIERAIKRLAEKNFRPYWHQRVPPNDGGISLGQIAAAGVKNSKGKKNE